MSLTSFPNEIILLIAEELPRLRDVSYLLCTNKRLNVLLTPHLYARAKSLRISKDPLRRTGEETLLNYVTKSGFIRPVAELLNVGASITESYSNEPYAFYTAAKYGHEEIVKLMISRSTEKLATVCKPMSAGRTVLHVAAENGHDGIVRVLIENGFSELQPTDDGETPLVFAVKRCQQQVVQTLFDFGASPNTKLGDPNRSKSIIHWVAQNSFALMTLRGYNFLPILRMLLDNGTNVMARDHYRATALHYYAKHGEALAVSVLGPCIQGRKQRLLDARAVYNEMVQLLIERGADINARDQGGRTPLHNAAEQLDAFMVRKLLENGADRRLANGASKTALRLAFERGLPRAGTVITLLEDWSIGAS